MHIHRVFRVVPIFMLAFTAFGCSGWPGFEPTCDPDVSEGLPHSCHNDNEPGTQQGKCRDYSTDGPCDPGLMCLDDACIPCGEDGQICCPLDDGSVPDVFCDPGVACQPGNDDWPVCDASCGAPGKPCCPADYDHCPVVTNSFCNNDNVCQLLDDPCNSGTGAHIVYIVEGGCVGTAFPFLADTDAAIQECVASISTANGGVAMSQVDPETTCEDWCKNTSLLGDEQVPVCYVVSDGPQACQANWCLDGDCTWAPGDCDFL